MQKVGKILLLISGIALLVVGGWSLITALIGLIAAIGGLATKEEGGVVLLVAGIIIFIASILCLLFYLFAGIRGIKTFTKGDEKNIKKSFVWGIIILILDVFSMIFSKSFGAFGVGLIIDIAYITGAFMVKFSK